MTLVDVHAADSLDVMGALVQVLTPLAGTADGPCVLRGTIPPGIAVPLHTHADPETFLHLSGELEALVEHGGAPAWERIRPGSLFHVPGGRRHAFRNPLAEPAVSLILSTERIAGFFRQAAERPGDVEAFLALSERYGYWNATPEENAAVGAGPV